MATIASLNAVFGMKTSGFEKGAQKISKKTKQMAADMNRFAKMSKGQKIWKTHGASIKNAAAAMLALGAATVAYTIKMAAAADATAKFSRRLGVSFEEMQKLEHIAKLTGTSSAVMQRGLKNMTKGVSEASLGVGIAKKELEALGLEAKKLKELSPDKQFREIAKAMKGVENTSDKVRIAFGLFGGKGVDLINTLNEVEAQLKRIEGDGGLAAGILSEKQALNFEKMNDDIADTALRLKGVMADNASGIASAISAASKVAGAAMVAVSVTADSISKTYDRWTMSEDELADKRADAKQQVEKIKIKNEELIQLKKDELKIQQKITIEEKKQEESIKKKKEFSAQTKALLEGEMTDREKALQSFREFETLQFETGDYSPEANKALEIAREKIFAIDKEQKKVQSDKIAAIKKEGEERAKIEEQDLKNRQKNAKILFFDDAIKKAQLEKDKIQEDKISERKLGFAQSVSKGVTSKGLVSGNVQVNKQQLDTQKKQLKVNEEMLIELKKEREIAKAS